jgi:hypothetical protein
VKIKSPRKHFCYVTLRTAFLFIGSVQIFSVNASQILIYFNTTNPYWRELPASHGSKSDDCHLLGCDDVQLGISVVSFQIM